MNLRTSRPLEGRTAVARARRSSAVLVLVLAALCASTGDRAAAGTSLFAGDAAAPTIDQLPAVVLAAHRAGGLEAPENSLSGVRRALTSGVVDVVELDVRRLADGALGVMHDPTVDRVTTATGATASYSRAAWRTLRLDVGGWLRPRPEPEAPPTLRSVLERFGHRTVFSVEVKEGLVDDVARLLRSLELTDSVFVNTNQPAVAHRVHELGLRSHLWRTASQMRTDDPRTFVGFVDLLDLDVRARSADFSRGVSSGVPLVWSHTITTRAERDRAMRLGATGIVTDDPRYVAGVTDTFPASPTLVTVRRAPAAVQVSDRTSALVAVSSQSGPSLREASVTVASEQVTGRTTEKSRGAVSTVRMSAAAADRGRTEVGFRVAAGRAGERRWPAARTSVPLRVTGEDLQLGVSTRVTDRGLRVDVRLLDSAAAEYTGPRAEGGRGATLADLRAAGMRLRVLRGDRVVHRDEVNGADTGDRGDGVGTAGFRRWEAPRRGSFTVRVVQRGSVYRRVVVERRLRLG